MFDHVAAEVAAPRGSVLFVDDNMMNVEAARSAGFDAHRARGVDEARDVLISVGLLA
jgi:putative hydrolase of the HAD superfamily